MERCLDWNPREFSRLVGIVTSGSRASMVPVKVSREDIDFVRDEMLAIVDDMDEGRRYLGVFKGSTKKDLALDATALPTSFDPERAHMYSAPSMVSFVEILGELSCSGIDLSFSIPRPGSYVYAVVDGRRLQKLLGIERGLRIGVHKFSSMEIHLDPKALCYHVAILGATGTGKSRLAKCIVEEALMHTDYSIVVFDHTGLDYADRARWGAEIEIVDASRMVLDPDVVSQIIVEEMGASDRIEEYIYGAVVEYIKRKLPTASAQQNDRKTHDAARHHEPDIETILSMYREASRRGQFVWGFNEFLQVLEDYVRRIGGYDTTIRKLKLFMATRIGRRFFEDYLNGRTVVIDDLVDGTLSGHRRLVILNLSSEVEYIAKRGIVYQFMKAVWDRIAGGREGFGFRRLVVVIDEAHNYSCTHGCEPAKSIIARTAREGRKWGFGVVLVSQRVIDLAPEIRGNVNTIFFSRLQSSGDYHELRNWIEGVQYLEYTLPMLSSREFFFTGLGNALRKPILIRVRDVS